MPPFRSLLSRLFGRRAAPPAPPATAPSKPDVPAPPPAPARETEQGPGPVSAPAAPPPPAPETKQEPGPVSAPVPPPPPETKPADVARRAQRAAERILSNESLTADLDDQAAQTLLDWTLARAQAIAEGTAGLDDAAAQMAMAPRLQALDRMGRLVGRWATSGRGDLVPSIVTQAAIVYGTSLQEPRAAAASTDDPAQAIRRLREAIEGQVPSQ